MIDKLFLQLDGSLGSMNIDGDVVETLLNGITRRTTKSSK